MFQTQVCLILEGSQYHCICESEQPSNNFFAHFFLWIFFSWGCVFFSECLATFDLLLLVSFLPQIKPTAKPSEVNVNYSVQASLIFYFFRYFPFFTFFHAWPTWDWKLRQMLSILAGIDWLLANDAYFKPQKRKKIIGHNFILIF